MRQRVRSRGSALRFVGRLLVLALAGALIWYGLMTILLAAGVSPGTVDRLSGYRTAYDFLTGLTPQDVSGTTTRAIVAGVGLLAFLVFGLLALRELPRPYLTRQDLELTADERGEVVVEPRAIERMAETAAAMHPAVSGANGRYGVDELSVDVSVRRARDVADTLSDVQGRVRRALDQHGLPAVPVDVTLSGFDRKHRRELS